MSKSLEQLIEENQITKTPDGQLHIGSIDKTLPFPKGVNPTGLLEGTINAYRRQGQREQDPSYRARIAVGNPQGKAVTSADSVLGFLRNLAGSAGEMVGGSPTEMGTTKGLGKTALDIGMIPVGGNQPDMGTPEGQGPPPDPLGDLKRLLSATVGRVASGIQNHDPYELSGGIGASAPFVGPIVKGGVEAVKAGMPDAASLELRAANLKTPRPPNMTSDAVATGAGSVIGGALGGVPGAAAGVGIAEGLNLLRKAQPIRNVRAAAFEKFAKVLAAKDKSPVFPATQQRFQGEPTPTPPTVTPRNPLTYSPPSERMAQAARAENVPPITERQPLIEARRQQTVYQPPPSDVPPTPLTDVSFKPPAGPATEIHMTNPPTPGMPTPKPRMTAPELNRWMDVQPKQMVHGANPAQQILTDGLLGPTKEVTMTNVKNALTDAGTQMDSVLADAGNKGVRINAEQSVMDGLDNATKTIGRRTDQAFQQSLSNVLDDILHKYPDLREMPPPDVHALKVDIGDAVKWGKGTAYEADLNQALIDIYGKLNEAIKTNVEGIGSLQGRWGNLYQGVKSLQNSILKDQAGRGTGSIPMQSGTTKFMKMIDRQ